MNERIRFTLAEASAAVNVLREAGERAVTTQYARGTMELRLYAPRGVDDQQPHDQDELYVVISGSGTFVCDGERVKFEPGDALFAAAGVEHHFENFGDDFETWVIFYGADGGEADTVGPHATQRAHGDQPRTTKG